MKVTNIAMSGLHSAAKRLEVSANNVANQLSNDGDQVYRAQRVQQTSVAQGGVQTQVSDKDPATVQLPENGEAAEFPNVDEAEEVVQQQLASYDFKANLRVLKAADEMAEELIDISA